MKTRKTTKVLSFLLLLSLLLSVFSVIPMAAGADTNDTGTEVESDINVIYNRTFDEGWNYDNGLIIKDAGNHLWAIESNKLSPSKYNHYLKVTAVDTEAGYVYVDASDYTPTSGRIYFEIDVRAAFGTHVGPVVTSITNADPSRAEYNYLVSLINGDLYILGERVCALDLAWNNICFVYDFDYDKGGNEYQLTAYYGDGKSVTKTYDTIDGSFGIGKIRIGMPEGTAPASSFDVDNVKLYSGSESFTDISELGAGKTVDESKEKNFPLEGYVDASASGILSGAPELDRIDYSDALLDDAVSKGEKEAPTIFYNRHYGEGWDYINGTTESDNRYREMLYELRYDYDSELNRGDSLYNYYWHLGCLNTQNGFVVIKMGSDIMQDGKLYVEFDIKASADINTRGAVQIYGMKNAAGSNEAAVLAAFQKGELYVLNQKVGAIGDTWVHLAFEFNYNYATENNLPPEKATNYEITAYVGKDKIVKTQVLNGGVNGSGKPLFGIDYMRIGFHGQAADAIGDSYGLDNFQIYRADSFLNLPNDEYGKYVKTDKPKDFAIMGGGEAEASHDSIIASSLVMKIKVNRALINNERVNIYTAEDGTAYGAPVKVDGQIYVPLQAVLDFTKATYFLHDDSVEIYMNGDVSYITFGEEKATISNNREYLTAAPAYITDGDNSYAVIAMEDVEKLFPGFFVTYDGMGIMFINKYKNFIHRDNDGAITTMVNVMRRFIFEYPDEDTVYDLAKENTNNFEHPYIIANADKFTELRDRYFANPGDENYDQTFVQYVDNLKSQVDKYVKKYAFFDEYGRYAGLSFVPTNPYTESGGYDPAGGRLNIAFDTYLVKMEETAFIAQVTHECQTDEKGCCDGEGDCYAHGLARFAYDFLVAMCAWEHWCEDHILHCAHIAGMVGLPYDWLYNMWVSMGLDPSPIEEGLYRNGVAPGWRSVNGVPCWYPRWNGHAHSYHTSTNNWNNVGVNGFNIASFAIMGNDNYANYCKNLVAVNIMAHGTYCLELYAPDGSYSESAGYWDAATGETYYFMMALVTILGSDYGYSDTWGFDNTCYYGCHVESPDFITWNYHDGTTTPVGSDFYFIASLVHEDPAIYDLRQAQLKNGKENSIWDILFYQFDRSGDEVTLPLSYHMVGIDGFTARSSWEKGAVFAGLMGGLNNAGHANVDSGNFVYHVDGTIFFCDLGMGAYNSYKYFSNYNLYHRGGEGQNIVIVAGQEDILSYGQELYSRGVMYETYTDEHGAYALVDNVSVYKGVASYARRGIFFTNDFNTVVIQDEIAFVNTTEAYWLGHFDKGHVISVEVDDTGRVATMTSKGGATTVRVTLVTDRRDVRFEVLTAYDFFLDTTFRPGQSEELGAQPETDRTRYGKLVIKGNERNPNSNFLSYEMAVVIEKIDPDNPVECGYSWTAMDEWVPYADNRQVIVEQQKVDVRKRNGSAAAVRSGVSIMAGIADPFGAGVDTFYEALAGVMYARNKVGNDQNIINLGREFEEALWAYEDYLESYVNYFSNAYAAQDGNNTIIYKAFGLL